MTDAKPAANPAPKPKRKRQRKSDPPRRLDDDQRGIVVQYLPLAFSMAAKNASRFPRHREDIFASALLGLCQAAATFDPTRGINFAVHARRRVVGAILDAIRSEEDQPVMLESMAEFDIAQVPLPPVIPANRSGLKRLPLHDYAAAWMVGCRGLCPSAVDRELGWPNGTTLDSLERSRRLLDCHNQ
jgi:hypothetical protein